MKNKIRVTLKNFWEDERGVGETADRVVWLVVGLGAVTVASFALVGALRGLAARNINAINSFNP